MLPYFATEVEKELRVEGRLIGEPGFLNYNFIENSLDRYYDFVTSCFMKWLSDPNGLVNISKWIRNYFLVYQHFFESTQEVSLLHNEVRCTISESNLFMLNTMKELTYLFDVKNVPEEEVLGNYRENITSRHEKYVKQINSSTVKLYKYAGISPAYI
jgi:hypothetical protein